MRLFAVIPIKPFAEGALVDLVETELALSRT